MIKGLIKLGTVLVVIIITGLFGLLMAYPIMWTWNYSIPHIWGLPSITWGQAWCLDFLAGLLVQSTLNNASN